MSDKHPLRTFILGTAIGGLLLCLLQWLTGFVSTVWHASKSASIWLSYFLLSSIPIPIWLIIIILPLIISTVLRLFSFIKQQKVDHPTFREYNQDEIMGITWRWRYTFNGAIDNLYCLCPDDATQLIYEDWGSTIYFRCETCGRKFGPFEGKHNYVIGKIERQIHRKLRTEEWKEIVERTHGGL